MSAKVLPIRRSREEDPVLGDEALATAATTGDAAAVAELFDRFERPTSRFLSRVVGPGPDVEDLVQATFLEIARGRARFDGRSTARTWLFGIAANVARHHIRSLARRKKLARAMSSVPREPEPGTASRTDARRQLLRVSRALEELPAAQRVAFVMCEVEGQSAREAGRALGASEAAVWKRVSLARKALRSAALEEES